MSRAELLNQWRLNDAFMSNRLDNRPLVSEEQAYAEVKELFADHLKRFTAYHEAVERLERNLSIMALAASIAASSSTTNDNRIRTDDGAEWQKDVALMENIHLCHRSLAGETEYAAMEYFPARDRHEIWNRGRDAMDVVRAFALEQRSALRVWTEDLTAQVKEFLTEKHPGQALSRVAESFVSRFTHSASPPAFLSSMQDHGQETRV